MADKYYVYGCSHLLSNLRDLISVAARFEEEDKSIEEWLRHEGIKMHSSKRKLTWGSAINLVIIRRTKQLLRIREDSMADWPF